MFKETPRLGYKLPIIRKKTKTAIFIDQLVGATEVGPQKSAIHSIVPVKTI